MASITELVYYPVKGCAGTSVPDAVLTPAGIAHDRSFLVTDSGGVFRSQRKDPSLAVIRPDVSPDGRRLTLHAPGVEPVAIDVDTDAPGTGVTLFGKPYLGIDQGDTVADWLSEVLASPSRLVRVPPGHQRVTGGHTPGTAGYADSHAVLVTSLSSLDLLNDRMAAGDPAPMDAFGASNAPKASFAASSAPKASFSARYGGARAVPDRLPMNRFRPNVVVAGWDPHVEDGVRRLTAGDVELGYAKLDIRCVVTTVDQATGVKCGPEPLRTLATYRRASVGGVAFGVKFSVVRPGKLSVGDEVTVNSWGASEL